MSPSPHRPNGTSILKKDQVNHSPWLLQLEVGTWFHAGIAAGVAAADGGVASVASVDLVASADPVGGVALASMKVESAADEEEEEAEGRGLGDAANAAEQSGANKVLCFH